MPRQTLPHETPQNPDRGGIYALVLRLREPAEVRIGRLGNARLAPGIYAYIGSARRGVRARLSRHLRVNATRHWHIDYLRPFVEPIVAWAVFTTDLVECECSDAVLQQGGTVAIPRFGASDCRCPTHLWQLRAMEDLVAALATVSARSPVRRITQQIWDESTGWME